jgi:hypothetical protein
LTGSCGANSNARATPVETRLIAHLNVRVSLRLCNARVFPGARCGVHLLGGDVWRFRGRSRAGLAVAVVPQQAHDVHVAHRELDVRREGRANATRSMTRPRARK